MISMISPVFKNCHSFGKSIYSIWHMPDSSMFPTEAKFLIFDMDDFGLRCFMVLSGISPNTLDIGRLELG
jgi:hypothetical protein